MSGTDYTTTPNLKLYKPIRNKAVGTWGDLWNSNVDTIDALGGPTGSFAAKAFVQDTPPTNPLPGQLWFDSSNPQLYVWFVDPTSAQWVIATAYAGGLTTDAPSDGQTYGRQNGAWLNIAGSGGYLPISGAMPMTGPLTLSGNATLALHAVPLQQLNSTVAAATAGGPFLPLSGGTVTGTTTFNGLMTTAAHLTSNATASNLFVNTTALGSGVNGPLTAQIGASISLYKDNWFPGPAAVGEIDGLSIICRQGGAGSDCGGILVNVQNTGLGFLAIADTTSSVANSSAVVTQQIGIQLGTHAPSSGQYFGAVANATVGSLTSAFQAQNATGASWQYAFTNVRNGVQNYSIDANGNVVSLGAMAVAGAIGSGTPTGTIASFILSTVAGNARNVTFRTGSLNRWNINATAGTESLGGTNTGSDFQLDRYDDNGNYLSTPISIPRFNGQVNIGAALRVNGNFGLNGTPIAKPTLTGAKGSNAALASVIAALVAYGLATDSTTA